VGIRETVGFPFRHVTLRGKWIWRLRHSKWFFFVFYAGLMVVSLFPPTGWTASFVGAFYLIIVITYFGSFFITPLTGNRFYCRYLCPYGATFGLLNHVGFYGIDMETDKCNDCRRCEQVCDMGIPVWSQGKTNGHITGLEDCMGCARCVVSCPTDALAIRDIRNLFRPALVQNGSHLLKKKLKPTVPRRDPPLRPVHERLNDWAEIAQTPDIAWITEQASRCQDCGSPGCRDACPLSNRIPDWLKLAAEGDIIKAAEIAHSTSSMPEICGRLCPQHRLCEAGCTLAPGGQAVTIGALEQAITDAALKQHWKPKQPALVIRMHKVAIIGAGPAGLACAERLAREGIQVTVFDKADRIGGQLALSVPSFKLDGYVLERRVAVLADMAVQFRLGVSVDQKMMSGQLVPFEAVFLGFGAHEPRQVELPGQEKAGVWQAWNFLYTLKNGGDVGVSGCKVLVLGGGDTAMDCARSALRAGAASVSIAYRRSEVDMRAGPRDVRFAREEGARFLFRHRPKKILGRGKTSGVCFVTDKGEQIRPCDTVILAFGFKPAPPGWLASFDVMTGEDGRILVDGQGRTSNARIYAGGDNTNGPDLVVTAIAGGYAAAGAILEDLSLKGRIRRKVRSGLGPAGSLHLPEKVVTGDPR
jgi:glutamate synthase (NADPH/NADH) small chain